MDFAFIMMDFGSGMGLFDIAIVGDVSKNEAFCI